MSQYLIDTIFELRVRVEGAQATTETVSKGSKIKIDKDTDTLIFYIDPTIDKPHWTAKTLPVASVVLAKPNLADCTLEIKTKKGGTYHLTFYVQSHLYFFAKHLPKPISTAFPKSIFLAKQPKNQIDAIICAPKVMKNPLVLIIAVSDYANPANNLSGAKHDLNAYRSVFENEYGWYVLPKNGTERNRKGFWLWTDILNFIKKERGRLFDEGDEKEQKERYDGLVVVLRGHGNDGTICDSECNEIPLSFLHDMVSFAQDPRFEALPRIFIVDACRGARGEGDDEKQSQGANVQPQGDYWEHSASHGQRNNLVTLYGNVSGFVTWALPDTGLFSAAVLKVLKQNARRQKELAFLATDIRKELKNQKRDQILVLDGDASLNPLFIRPSDKFFPKALREDIKLVSNWLNDLTEYGCVVQSEYFFDAICDGHLLCLALNAIKSGTCSIKYPISREENRLENIKSFIGGCVKLGVKECFVIKPEALDSERNIVDVVCNLYALSHNCKRSLPNCPYIKQCDAISFEDNEGGDHIGRFVVAGDVKIAAQGYGKTIYKDGDMFAGGIVNGKREGWGTFERMDGYCYKGEFKNHDMNGYGKEVWANGSVYEGSWKDGKRHGYGKYLSTNGDVYEGEFENSKMHGHGKGMLANGDVYEGPYENGEKHGKGVFTSADGKKYDVEYDNGKQTKKTEIKL